MRDWMQVQAEEEREHAAKFSQHMLNHCGGSWWPRCSSSSIARHRVSSSQPTRVTATPEWPARPVRPMRWTYVLSSSGDW
ncbi:hypothetical protein [Corynebacterium bovis]|uniref:hypothetical protein n=1 Tax=Corynebacterium bovis TaxID=36808 RepID=UPI0035DBB302